MPEGQDVTFTAVVSGAANSGADAAGTVAFKEGKRVLGYGVIRGGVASFTASGALKAGSIRLWRRLAGMRSTRQQIGGDLRR